MTRPTATVDAPTTGLDCLFCRRDDPTVNDVIDESDEFYARWDNYPASDGHIEVVPKRHVNSFFELDAHEVSEAFELLKRVQKQIDEKYKPDAYTIGINDGRAAGRTVDHLHIHLIPRYAGDVEDPRGGVRQILPGCDPDAWSPKPGA
jgi:diadenosine tetraphosphate (Ap4A) HIT family hydrolase